MQNGNNIFISLDGNAAPFACTKADSIHTEAAAVDISSPNTADWEEILSGRKRWSFNTDFLVGDFDDISHLLIAGNFYNIGIYGGRTSVIPKLIGRALCTQADIKAERASLSKGSISFRGTGPLAPPTPVTGITLSSSSLSFRVNYTRTLATYIAPSAATIKKVIWSTSNGSVAQVSKSGVVKGIATGTCTIRATAADGSGVYAECSVTITT